MNDRQINEALHQFLVARSGQITAEWLVSPEEVKENPYVSNAKLDQILQEMKQTFSTEMIYMFNMDESGFQEYFRQQAEKVVEKHNGIWQLYFTIQQEVTRYRNILLEQIEEFVKQYETSIPNEVVLAWHKKALRLLDHANQIFMQEAFREIDVELERKEQVITKLTAPVIQIEEHIGLLPLMGEINTDRGHVIIENTLKQCQLFGLNTLLIDFSGVVQLDPSIVDHLHTLVRALNIIGITTYISGVRPHTAEEFLSYDFIFRQVPIFKDLQAAIRAIHHE